MRQVEGKVPLRVLDVQHGLEEERLEDLQPTKIDLPLDFEPDKCNNGCARFLVARRMAVAGFLPGGRTIGMVSEGFCNYLSYLAIATL